MDLNTVWFLLLAVLLIGYGILDGFDLGVGVLSLFAKSDEEKRLHMNAIGPVWDGNEVWLLTGGGAMFAAFPGVYASVFSGFYLAFMLLLLALILRAVSFEFRSKVADPRWRSAWDIAFAVGSLVPAFLYGVAMGNILQGIPIDAQGVFQGNFFTLLYPYPILVGLVTLTFFVMHGAIWMAMKTTGELQARMVAWGKRAWVAFVVLYAVATAVSVWHAPDLFAGLSGKPLFYLLALVLVAAIAYLKIAIGKGAHLKAFIASSLTITAMSGLTGLSLYPRLVPSSLDPAFTLTIYNASSTPRTLTVMLVIALLGMPLVIGYTSFIYWAFRGKVEITEHSY